MGTDQKEVNVANMDNLGLTDAQKVAITAELEDMLAYAERRGREVASQRGGQPDDICYPVFCGALEGRVKTLQFDIKWAL